MKLYLDDSTHLSFLKSSGWLLKIQNRKFPRFLKEWKVEHFMPNKPDDNVMIYESISYKSKANACYHMYQMKGFQEQTYDWMYIVAFF